MNDEEFYELFPDGAAYEAARRGTMRKSANEYLRLYLICEEARCRRARRCVVDDSPCMWRYHKQYFHLMPPLQEALKAKMARRKAEKEKAPSG
jgi:hypothetical protein